MENQTTINTVSQVEFKGTTTQMNLATLSKSATHLQVSGMLPASRPVHHFQLIEWLQKEMSEITGHNAIIEPITVSARHASRIRTDINEVINPKDPCPIEKLNIQRLVTRVAIPIDDEVGGERVNPAIGVCYNDRGIELAYGTNVWTCSNMNVFGENKYSTYGADKVTFDVLRTVVLNMLKDWRAKFERDKAIIKTLQETPISQRKATLLVGKLFKEAVKVNVRHKEKQDILNTTQCIRLQEELLKKVPNADDMITAWDFCQAGTEHLKPTSNDLVSLYPAVQNFNNWLVDEMELAY